MRRQQCRQGLICQKVPYCGIAEKARYTDQDFLEQQFNFLRIGAQIVRIIAHTADLVQVHAPCDPAVERMSLVRRKVIAGMLVQ